MKNIVIDLDETLAIDGPGDCSAKQSRLDVIETLQVPVAEF